VKAVPLLYDWEEEPYRGMNREEIAG